MRVHAHAHTAAGAPAVHSPPFFSYPLQVLWAPLGCHPSLSHTGPIIVLHTALHKPACRWDCPAGYTLFLRTGRWPNNLPVSTLFTYSESFLCFIL